MEHCRLLTSMKTFRGHREPMLNVISVLEKKLILQNLLQIVFMFGTERKFSFRLKLF